MKSHYKKLGSFIREVVKKNSDLNVTKLLGVSITKKFIPSIANTVGTDMSNYKVVRKGQFAYGPVTSRNGDKISIALLEDDECIVSTSYTVFEIIDENLLDPNYLMMWFKRSEFNRYARFKSHGSVREIFDWNELCDCYVPIPAIEVQKSIAEKYKDIVRRININKKISLNLEKFIVNYFDEIFSSYLECEDDEIVENLEKYIEFNPSESIKKGEVVSYVEMADLQQNSMNISGIIQRPFSSGSKFKNGDTLLARITPCMENGKAAFVNCLKPNEIAFGSTEFIVMRATSYGSPYFNYCLVRNNKFRSYAISSMSGSDGRQRVQHDYLKQYPIKALQPEDLAKFNHLAEPIFKHIENVLNENQELGKLAEMMLSRLAIIE